MIVGDERRESWCALASKRPRWSDLKSPTHHRRWPGKSAILRHTNHARILPHPLAAGRPVRSAILRHLRHLRHGLFLTDDSIMTCIVTLPLAVCVTTSSFCVTALVLRHATSSCFARRRSRAPPRGDREISPVGLEKPGQEYMHGVELEDLRTVPLRFED